MSGYILLEGGAEFGGRMAEPDRRAIDLAGGPPAAISIIPAAAAPDNNHRRAGANGVRWFEGLGASNVRVVPVIDPESANGEAHAATLRESRLIYLLGGFTHHLGQTLKDSLAWAAAREAFELGAVIAGSSAGAMVLCSHYFDPSADELRDGLGLVPNSCVLPHHDTFGHKWADSLSGRLPSVRLIGIDEQTGMINDGASRTEWTVYGAGAVTLYRRGRQRVYRTGAQFTLDDPG